MTRLIDTLVTKRDDIHPAEQFDRERRNDARLVALWLADQGIHPAIVASEADTWTEIDWSNIADETGIPCPQSVRSLAIELLETWG